MKESKRAYIIAEMACSHEGDPELARKIIDGAGEAGVDAVQVKADCLGFVGKGFAPRPSGDCAA